jgi:fibronectin-binding autotransporter adhesin
MARGFLCGLVILLAGAGVARAATCTWQASGTADWSSSTGNWTCGRLPRATDDVVFNRQGSGTSSDCNITTAISVNSITISNYNGTITGSANTIAVTTTFSEASGVFTAGSGAITIGGTLTVSAGAFTASSTTTTVGGSFTHSGGTTLLNNGGTLILDGTSAAGQITTGGSSLGLLTVSGSGTYTLQDDLITTGAVAVSAGTLTAGANAVPLAGGLTNSSCATFNASSGITSGAGAFNKSTGGTFNANGGTFFFNGTTTLSHTFGGAQMANAQVGLGTSGLVGYWKLDETSGTTAADSSGNSNGGTWASGASATTSVPSAITFSDPRAISLDGSANGYVTLGTNNFPANNAPQSIALWFKGATNGNNENFLVMANPVSGSAVQLGFRGSNLLAWNWGGTTLVSTAAPSNNVWHHVIYTYDGESDKIYVDGVLKATSTTAPHQTGTPTVGYLGTYSPGNEMFTGSLDDVRVYTRALSNVEISILAGGGSPSAIAGTHTFSDAFSCSGSFTVLAGNVNGSSTFSIGGNWLNAGAGTYTDTGLVTFTGTSTAGTITSGGDSFGALTINGSGGSYEFEDALSVAGNLTVTAGGLTGANPVTVGGNFFNAAAFNDLGTVTLTSASSGATITSGGARFSALTVNGSASTVYTVADRLWVPGGTITLTQGTLVGGSSTIHAGAFAIGAGSFSVGTSTVIFDGSANQSLPFSNFSGLRFEDPRETNLVGYWKLDEGQGTWLEDVSGSGNTGALGTAGITWTTSSLPTAVNFDDWAGITFNGSSTAYAQMGATNLPATDGAITISAWVKFASVSGTQDIVALVGSGGTNILQVGLRGGSYSAWPTSTLTSVTGPTATAGAWHHVAYTFDGTSVDTIYIDGSATTGSFTHQTGATSVAYLGTNTPGTNMLNGSLDDVRIYSVALTASQIKQLAAGRYAGTGGYATTTLSNNTTVSGLLALDAGNLDGNGKTMTAGGATPTTALVSCGTYSVSNAAQTFNGGLTVQPTGTLSLASSGGSVQIASGQTLTIDGALSASNTGAAIQGVSGASYTFKVGSVASATPTVNITGLAVKNTNGGMQIGATTAATATFTKFDNVAFSGGTGAQYLLINATSLFLSSTGCSFDAGAATGRTTVAVTLAGDGTGNGETRALFGAASCATNWALSGTDTVCTSTAKSDDDANNDGVADNPLTNGAVVEFVRSVEDDTAGSIVGFPTAAFDWSSFTYYSTYAAFNNASGGNTAVVYVRGASGNALYNWTDATANETITGTPQWVTVGGTHYLYVSVNGSTGNSGKIYRLIDSGSGLAPDASWPTASPTGAYACTCTITSDLSMDANNVYWAATTGASTQNLFGIIQSSGAKISTSWPVTTPANVSASSPTLFTSSGTTTLYLGLTSGLASLAVSGTTFVQDTKPGSITGRVSVGTSFLTATTGTKRIYVGDASFNLTAISPSDFTGTHFLWQYGAGAAITNNYYDAGTDTVQFGTSGGTIVALNAAGSGTGGSKVNSSYPFTLNASDPITAAPLYVNGVLAVGTTLGKLYFLDRNTGNATAPNGVKIMMEYYFGPTESVSTVGYDSNMNRFMVTTSSSSAKDGRLYYFDAVTDPTPGSL